MLNIIPTESWEYNLHDLFIGLTALLRTNKNSHFMYIQGVGNCIPFRSGRVAIIAAIKALELKPGASIAVPLYSCPVVFKAIKEVGCIPVFIDIDRETFCISPEDLSKKISRVDAVVAIHIFGHLCDMHRLIEVVRGKPIIEDCAQSLYSKINGYMSGTIGTIGIFSFRSGKYLSVGEGGAIFSKNPEIRSRLSTIVSSMKVPSKTEEVKHILKTYLRTKLRCRPLFGLIGRKIWQIYNRKVDFAEKTPIIFSQILNSDRRITLKRLVNLNNKIQMQRMYAEYYLNNLRLDSNMLFSEKPGTFYNRYAYPIVFSSIEQRDAMANYLLRKKIDTVKPYQDIAEIASEHYGYKGDCPVTEQVSKFILIIPSYYKLKKHDIHYICACFNDGLKKIL